MRREGLRGKGRKDMYSTENENGDGEGHEMNDNRINDSREIIHSEMWYILYALCCCS